MPKRLETPAWIATLGQRRKLKTALRYVPDKSLLQYKDTVCLVIEELINERVEKVKDKEKITKALDQMRSQLQSMGVATEEIEQVVREQIGVTPSGRKRLEPRYEFYDEHGTRHTWAGVGLKPVLLQEKINQGAKLEDFLIVKDKKEA